MYSQRAIILPRTQGCVPPLVSDYDLERELEIVRSRAAGTLEGVFGPHSLTWRVNREAVLFLGAARALYLQLAHPWVAVAIAQHPGSLTNPLIRFHRTFRTVFTLIFGTLDQAFDTARHLHRRHSKVRGRLPSPLGMFPAGTPYWANELGALCWVHATLTETALLIHDLILPSLTDVERETYYTESKLLASLLGIPSGCLPYDWNAFVSYSQAMCRYDRLAVGPEATAILQQLLGRTKPWSYMLGWYESVTAELLPGEVRRAYGLRYGENEHRIATQAIARIRRVHQMTPTSLCYVGPYHEAMSRLSGRASLNWGTRTLNRFWIGQSRLDAERRDERD